MEYKKYKDLTKKLEEIEKILEGCELRKERMYPDQYRPVKEKIAAISGRVSSISEF